MKSMSADTDLQDQVIGKLQEIATAVDGHAAICFVVELMAEQKGALIYPVIGWKPGNPLVDNMKPDDWLKLVQGYLLGHDDSQAGAGHNLSDVIPRAMREKFLGDLCLTLLQKLGGTADVTVLELDEAPRDTMMTMKIEYGQRRDQRDAVYKLQVCRAPQQDGQDPPPVN